MWWWILCVNLTRPWNPSIWSNILDVAVRVFWRIRLIFKSVGSKSGRLPFIIRVSLIQSAAGLNTMKTDLPGERRNSAHWQPMEMKCSISSSLGLQPASLPSPTCGSLSHVESQFLKINLSFGTLSISCHSFLACKAYVGKSVDSLIGVPL